MERPKSGHSYTAGKALYISVIPSLPRRTTSTLMSILRGNQEYWRSKKQPMKFILCFNWKILLASLQVVCFYEK